jgi:hypothetical protein
MRAITFILTSFVFILISENIFAWIFFQDPPMATTGTTQILWKTNLSETVTVKDRTIYFKNFKRVKDFQISLYYNDGDLNTNFLPVIKKSIDKYYLRYEITPKKNNQWIVDYFDNFFINYLDAAKEDFHADCSMGDYFCTIIIPFYVNFYLRIDNAFDSNFVYKISYIYTFQKNDFYNGKIGVFSYLKVDEAYQYKLNKWLTTINKDDKHILMPVNVTNYIFSPLMIDAATSNIELNTLLSTIVDRSIKLLNSGVKELKGKKDFESVSQ